jgi:PAS domain S-box-containing protein
MDGARVPTCAPTFIPGTETMSVEIPSAVLQLVNSVQVPLVLSDPTQREDPLILVNAAFCQMSGYLPAEVLGKNCRILQGIGTQTSVRQHLRKALSATSDTHVLIRNYRKNGEAFDNFLHIFNVVDAKGSAVYRIGSQFAVPARNKAAAFEHHAAQLHAGLERLNREMPANKLMIRLVDVEGSTVRELLQARMDVLKHQAAA